MPKLPKLETPLQRVLAMRDGDWFKSHMDDYYETSESPRIDPGWFHPSDLAHPCDAYLAFKFLGIEPRGKVTSRLRRIWDNGHSTEGRWQEAIISAGIAEINDPDPEVRKQQRLIEIPQYRIRGELDNIIKHPLTNERFVWDCKTMNSDQYGELRAPLNGHVIQMHPYMFAKDTQQTMIMYENKDNQEYKTYIRQFDGQIWRAITERVERIMDKLARRVEIMRTPLPNDSRCPFHHMCTAFDFRKVGDNGSGL